MTMHLAMTTAGLAAIADADNVGTAAVRFTKLAIGAGTGSGSQLARTALIDQKMTVAVTGAASGAGRIAIRADYTPTESFAVTEVGLFARVGTNAEFLAAYWVASSSDGALASAAAETALVVAGVISIESSNADITVTPALNISVGVPDNVVLKTDHASADARGIVELATPAEAQAGTDAERAVTPAGLEARIGDIPSAVSPPNASKSRKGLVELATHGEAQGGTDDVRAVTPAGLASRTATTTRTGLVELATVTEAKGGTDSDRAVTPAGLKGAIDVAGGLTGVTTAKSATYNVTTADDGKTVEVDASAGAQTVNLPNLGASANGFTLTVVKTDSSSNTVTADGHGGDTINGATTYVLGTQWEAVILKWTGSAWIAIGGASGGFLRDFFGDASHREFTTAGDHSYTWEWGTETALLVIKGGGGGGGGGSISGLAGNVNGGGGGSGNAKGGEGPSHTFGGDGSGDNGGAGRPPDTGGGGGGDGGNRSKVVVNGATYKAEGGGGGGGVLPHGSRGGGGGIGENGSGGNIGHGVATGHGNDGGAGNGGEGGTSHNNASTGGKGGGGQVVAVLVTGLSIGDMLAITVGAGGLGGEKATWANSNTATDGRSGGPGSVTIYPIF